MSGRDRGAVMVETTLVLPLIVLFAGLLIETSLYLYQYSALTQTVQSANRALSLFLGKQASSGNKWRDADIKAVYCKSWQGETYKLSPVTFRTYVAAQSVDEIYPLLSTTAVIPFKPFLAPFMKSFELSYTDVLTVEIDHEPPAANCLSSACQGSQSPYQFQCG